MPLSEDDIREILRLIDESDVEELRIETDDLSLYVLRGEASAAPADSVPTDDAPVVADAASVEQAGALHTIAAPMLGTFYRAQAPGAPPYVEVGARVEEHTIVCLIEVMKMMNAVPAGIVGTVVEVCAENAELVESGAPLFRVRSQS